MKNTETEGKNQRTVTLMTWEKAMKGRRKTERKRKNSVRRTNQ